MDIIEKTFIASDNEEIFYYEILPKDGNVKCIFQIVHGMAEHSTRYLHFAEFMAGKGIAIYASDLRGHGRNIKKSEDYGLWPKKNTWSCIVNDIKTLNQIATNKFPEIPNFMLGHNIGSFIVRSYIIDHSNEIDGAVILGTGTYSKVFMQFMRAVINLCTLINGNTYRSSFVFNRAFSEITRDYPNYTWLTHDQSIVDKYNEDPYNGGIMTNIFYKGLCNGIIHINKEKHIRKIRKELPLYFVSGTGDPVGYRTKGVDEAMDLYVNAGMEDVELKLYDGGRHEMLNEINREEVYSDIHDWLINVMEKNKN